MRVVLDTNVLLAGVATHGLCETLLLLCYRDHEVILCEHLLREFAHHYRGKFRASDEQTTMVVDVLRAQSEIVETESLDDESRPDPDDLPILGAAVASRADCLVTGDQVLLNMLQCRGIPILSPRAFYDRLRE